MNNNESQGVTVYLDKSAHHYAEIFASQQATVEKGKKVYLNTLAVCAVNNYLKWLDIKTSLDKSDCWHSNLRAIFDVADIVLPSIGKLECRPLLPEEESLFIPPEARGDRLGYIAVKFGKQLDKVEILGFYPADSEAENISLSRLKSLDCLIDKLDAVKSFVNLKQWLVGIFPEEWQPPELILANATKNFRTVNLSNKITRCKVINFSSDYKQDSIVFGFNISQAEDKIDIILRFYPLSSETLPEGLEINLLDELETVCMEAKAKEADKLIELQFSSQPEEKFSVKIVVGGMSITEKFKT